MTDFGLGGFGGVTPHGTETKYRRGCRCDECRAGNAVRRRKEAERRASWSIAIPSHVHGTTNGYSNYDCRCDQCRAASTEAKRLLREEKAAFRETLARLREERSA